MANIAHDSVVSVMAFGSLSGDATEVFQEALRLLAVKIINEGVTRQSVMDLITCNSRMPDFLKFSFVSGLPLSSDEAVRLATSPGASYGVLTSRDKISVAADIKAGFIIAKRAAEVDGD